MKIHVLTKWLIIFALIKVQNDILSALDVGSSAILLMLDLSAAFDTIDHDILLSRLCNVYGITGNVATSNT